MQRLTVAAVAAAALSVVLLTGCAEDYSCTSTDPVYFNTEDGRYHYHNVGGPIAPDEDVKHGCARDSDGVDAGGVEVDIDAPKKPKPATVKPAPKAPAQKPAAPRPAAPRKK